MSLMAEIFCDSEKQKHVESTRSRRYGKNTDKNRFYKENTTLSRGGGVGKQIDPFNMSSSLAEANTANTIVNVVAVKNDVVNNNNRVLQPPPLIVRMVCEMIGTCLFVLFGAGCAAKTEDLLTVSAAHGIVTVWLVYVFGSVSGGHFNAGATLAFALDGQMKTLEVVGYLVSQALGSLLSGILLLWLYGTSSSLGTPGLQPGVTVMNGFAVELICTIVLSFVIFFTTTYNTHKEAALPIGLVVFSSFLLGADRDGAALNPWRWFGPAVASRTFQSSSWIYTIGPITGFLLGYAGFRVYKLIWNSPQNQVHNT